ncbi:hypothetical protein ACIP6X_05580 [Streptomyces coeruleorubidus]
MSTEPESRVVLQVPHMPCAHEAGRLRPARDAAAGEDKALVDSWLK